MISIENFQDIYKKFLNFFPDNLHGLVSFVLVLFLILGIYKIIKRQFVWIILLVILLPASVPILKSVWAQVLEIIKFLLS